MTRTANGFGAADAPASDPISGLVGSVRIPEPRLRDRLPKSRRQRRPAVAAFGLMLVVVFATLSAALAVRGDHSVAVLALARNVPAGHVLVPSDLRVAHISGSGVSAVPASTSSLVVGEAVTAALPAGTLLSAGMLTRATTPASGDQVIAIALKSGAVPAGVTAGRYVELVPVTGTGGRSAAATAGATRGRVVDVARDPSSGSTVLSVEVDGGTATELAQLAASGALAVTLLPVAP